jgi:tripartite-type tricarboxylate transporter receptor subunit TctC
VRPDHFDHPAHQGRIGEVVRCDHCGALAEQGLKGFEVVVWHGIYAPKGTPNEATTKFGAALKAALKEPSVVAKLDELGAVIVPDAKLTPAGLQTWLQQETARYAPVIKAAGQFAD